MKAQTLKGFRDFLPQDAIIRYETIEKIRSVFQCFGYDPIETPALEYASVLQGKYGEEADKLLYTFTDNGGRQVGLRYDQTVPTARLLSQHQHLLPNIVKRYQIQPVWRAENTQKGRYREFLQCDADIIGVKSCTADAEILALLSTCLTELGLQFTIKINSREMLRNVLKGIVSDDLWLTTLQSIDKLDKKSESDVHEELASKGLSSQQTKDIFENIRQADVKNDDWLKKTVDIATQSFGISDDQLKFDPTMVRGLDYYTGLIFEAIPLEGGSSIAGGGRYDNLISQMSGPDKPAIGFALGFDRIIDIISSQESKSTNTLVFVATISDQGDEDRVHAYASKTATTLRNVSIPTELNLDINTKLDKQLKHANKKSIPYVVIVGSDEKEQNVVLLKDMTKKTQLTVPIDKAISILTADN